MKVFQNVLVVLMVCLSFLLTNCFAGIPEPETIIYGKIINNYKGYDTRVTSGVLNWQIVDTQNKQFAYSTHLDNIDNTYSYVLKIPKETAASIILQSGNYLFDNKDLIVISEKAKEVSNTFITVDDYGAHIVSPAKNKLSIKQDARLESFRIDLEINCAPEDSDNDGIPDFWEKANNTDPNLAEDATMDPDNDGWDNKKEFEMGANPVVSNLIPAIAETHINQSIPSGARMVFNLNVLDSDSIHEYILIKLIQPPEGGSLILCNAADQAFYNDQILKKDDVFSAKDIASGRVHLKHSDPLIEAMHMQLQVWNSGAEDLARDYTTTITVWNPTDDFESSLWIDMFKPSENDHAALVDHSGKQNNSIEVYGQPTIQTNASPSGKSCLFMDGRSFYRYGNDPVKDASTIFSVFKSIGDKAQTLWGGSNGSLNLTDPNNPLYPAKLNVVTSEKLVYGSSTYLDSWLLSSIDLAGENVISFINNRSDQLTIQNSQFTSSDIYFQIAAQQNIVSNEQTNELSRTYSDQFEGYLAEILMISKEISSIDKWRIHGYLMSKWFGHVINDLSRETKDLDMRSYSFFKENITSSDAEKIDPAAVQYQDYVLIGGCGNDTIEGASGNDILVGGKGEDVLQGHDGKDIFVVGNGDTILDYDYKEGDVIHIEDIIDNNGGSLAQYIQFEQGDTYTLLGINADGQGEDYLDAIIRLEDILMSNKDISMLWANGHIESGGLGMPVNIEPALISDVAEESVQKPAEIELTINCDVIPGNLFIPYYIDGDGELGVDFNIKAQMYNPEKGKYTFEDIKNAIPVKLKPGDQKLIVQVMPIIDNISENDETITLGFQEFSTLYTLSNNDPFELKIIDGADLVKIESTVAAIQEGNNKTQIIISRVGAIDQDQRVDLSIFGNATNGDDYTYIPTSIVMRQGESKHTLDIEAILDEDTERPETIEVVIQESDSYVIEKMASLVVISIVDKNEPFITAEAKQSASQLAELITMLKILSGKSVKNSQPVSMQDIILLLNEMK
jgi:hypothetical protein